MAFNVNDFRSRMTYDGARPNLFEVYLTLPDGIDDVNAQSELRFKIKAAQLPGSTIGVVPVYYFGRELKFPGNRTFTDWTVTIINDEDFSARNSLEKWMSAINSHKENVRGGKYVKPLSYTADSLVVQWGKSGAEVSKSYLFTGMFPVDISPIDLDWGSNDSIEEFSVTFAYQYWAAGTTDGDFDKNIKPIR
jgi:hypothetical protein